MLIRLHRDESGFALVTAMVLLAVMSLLMVITLSAGESVNRLSARGAKWTRLLGVAEAGVHDAIIRISAAPSATPSVMGCPYDGSSTTGCPSPGGEYQVTWDRQARGRLVITAYGFYPSASAWLSGASTAVARKVEVTMAPPPTFGYALFSFTTLEVKNDVTVIGDLFANEKVTLGNNAIVCGSILNASLGVELGNGAQVVQSLAGSDCSSDANVHAGGTIDLGTTGVIEGNATASAPTEIDCPPVPDDYKITGGSVNGTATACGSVSTTTPVAQPNTKTAPPVTKPMPPYEFDPNSYVDLTCFPSSGTCDETNTSSTAVADFFASVPRTEMSGTYAIWQTDPTQATKIDLEGLTLSGDVTIVTNAPVDLGNTGEITYTGAGGYILGIVSLYVPPTGTTCSNNGGDCSIYGKNAVVLDSGDPNDPDDGIAALFYTPGKMAFKNQSNEGEGALWAGNMDLKNGFDITYNSRVERVTGFGGGLEQVLWEELAP
jgi:hypothetical protein